MLCCLRTARTSVSTRGAAHLPGTITSSDLQKFAREVLARLSHQKGNDIICIRRVRFHFGSVRLCSLCRELTYNTGEKWTHEPTAQKPTGLDFDGLNQSCCKHGIVIVMLFFVVVNYVNCHVLLLYYFWYYLGILKMWSDIMSSLHL